MTRTNLELDDFLVAEVMRRYGVTTKRAAVDLALRRLVANGMTRLEVLEMQGTGWYGDLSEIRSSGPDDFE